MKRITFVFCTLFVCLLAPSQSDAQINEGDTLEFWSVSYVDWPPLWGQPQRVVRAICRKAGVHCYVFVEDQAPAADPVALEALVTKFDTYYYPELTQKYGPVPNVFDQDSAVFILALNENNWAGYFDPGQQMSDSLVTAKWNRRSSEREIIYIAANYINYAQSTVAHEFGHLLHWRGDHSPEPMANPSKYWEEAWVDEGFSTFAAMYLTEVITQPDVQHSAFFTSNPDIPLIWFSSYNQVQLFMLFMYEHFGNWDYISTLINNQLNGIPGVESTLAALGYTQTFDDAFEQWAVANYIDDPVFENGKYSYLHYNFGSCHLAANHSAIPTGIKTGNTSAYGVDYVAFNSQTPKYVEIDFDGDDNGRFRLAFILMNTATHTVTDVVSVLPDSLNNASFQADSLGILYDRVVMVVMNMDSTVYEGQTTPYTYSAAIQTGIQSNSLPLMDFRIFPNPAEKSVHLLSNYGIRAGTLVEIRNMLGQAVITTQADNSGIGIDVGNLAPGVYTLGITQGSRYYHRKFVKK